ncbi:MULTISPECIES: flagellar motor protein MotB [unclassified Clostridium]|uniref:flagellar motor protein MotB n=1 Tax=unclassified Clostridium TaxID=2614128 RepID=UPI0013FCE91C|nr:MULTISPECIES: flagellar motor protein MotB [unclassified Clostridium]NFR88169.1 chemotaxis protein MotB [Clostridium botulinum]NFR91856.1 chemotaxis protein MotB [Clostridium botulinum]NFU00428.1 chemotaxis protein MotB [Clostridium botulinum]
MKKKRENKENSERWLLTYSDLITLLMVLFVVLYASSNVDKQKYRQISDSFKQAFSIGDAPGAIKEVGEETNENSIVNDAIMVESEKLDTAKSKVDELIKEYNLEGSVSTQIQERGLIISFNDNVFFNSGDATIKSEYKQKLISISKILNDIDNYIRVEGNTDNVAINTENFHSNWQLSAIRAANVVELLVKEGNISSDKLSAIGYGEYRPVKSNDTEEGRAANRRVDIVILNNEYNKSETSSIK